MADNGRIKESFDGQCPTCNAVTQQYLYQIHSAPDYNHEYMCILCGNHNTKVLTEVYGEIEEGDRPWWVENGAV